MNRHLIRLQRHSLAAIAMLFIVALISPTGAVAAPSCEKNPNHSSCPDGGGGGGGKSSDLYTVKVYFGNSVPSEPDGDESGVEGSGNEKRQKIGDVSMNLNLTRMSMALSDECLNDFGSNVTYIDGEFAISTARLSKSGDLLTYVTASFWNFVTPDTVDVDVDGSTYFLVFGPDGNAKIDDQPNWPPAGGEAGDSNFMSGTLLELQVINGPAKKGPCDRLEITLDWKIVVIKK